MSEIKQTVDERGGVKIYGGGVRGIRALKQNREELKDVDEDAKNNLEARGDRFKRFESRITKKNRLIIK